MTACVLFSVTSAGATDPSKKESAAGNNQIVQVDLKASRYNAGALGRATFVAMGGNSEVQFYVAGLQPWINRPIHIYTFIYPGTCAKLGKKPAFEMNDNVVTNRVQDDAWKVTKRLPIALNSLLTGNYAVVVRSSPADGNNDLFCGDIR